MSEDAEVDALRDSQAIWGELGWMPIEPLEINAGVRLENHSDYDFPVTGSLSAKWMHSELFALHGRLTNGFSPPIGFADKLVTRPASAVNPNRGKIQQSSRLQIWFRMVE